MDQVKKCTEVGNYILRSNRDENEFYTIIETEADTKDQSVYMYAEDAGLDLLNEVVGAYEADQDYPIRYYIEKFSFDSGFTIGINEASNLSRKLSWEGESTASERITSVATQFDNCEISYSFKVEGLVVTGKYINIYRKRLTMPILQQTRRKRKPRKQPKRQQMPERTLRRRRQPPGRHRVRLTVP